MFFTKLSISFEKKERGVFRLDEIIQNGVVHMEEKVCATSVEWTE